MIALWGTRLKFAKTKTTIDWLAMGASDWLAVGAGDAVTAALFFGGTAAEHETITNEEILL